MYRDPFYLSVFGFVILLLFTGCVSVPLNELEPVADSSFPQMQIDGIFTTFDIEVADSAIVDTADDSGPISDHRAVVADLIMPYLKEF